MSRAAADLDASVRLINAGFWAARALSSAVEIGLFASMGAGSWTPAELADRLSVRARGVEVLLRFLAAFGFCEEFDNGFQLTAAARELWSGRPSALETEALVAPDVWKTMEALTETVREEDPSRPDFFERLGPAQVAGFAATMEVQARRVAAALVDAVCLSGRQRLLDLGGGSGYLAAQMASRWPLLDVVVFERPEVVRHAGEGQRLASPRMVAGDMWTADPRLGHDVLLLSKILHDWADQDAERLLRRWVEPLPSGGLVIVCEVMLTHKAGLDRQWAALLDVFLFAAMNGRVRTPDEIGQLLACVNAEVVERRLLADGSTFVTASRA